MRLRPRRLDWYCVREMAGPFCTWMIALLVVVEGNFLFLLLKQARSDSLPMLQLILFLAFRLPFSIVLAIPMSYLFASCLAVARLVHDGEVTSIRSAGVSSRRLLAPFLAMGLVGAVGAFGVNEFLVPWANHVSQNSVRQMLLQQAQLVPSANMFVEGPEGFIFYAPTVNMGDGTLSDVMVFRPSATGYPDLWVADTGRFDDNRVYLQDVRIYQFGPDGKVRRCGAAAEQMLDLREMLDVWYRNNRERPDELNVRELLERARTVGGSGQPVHYLLYELHSKVAVPFATFVFVLLGAPLTLRFGRRGTFAGMVIAIGMIFLYYCVMAWGRMLGTAGTVAPFWAAWTQNLVFLAPGLVFYWRAR
jgi:lipopolysaccharide export system permease protein